MQVILKQDVKGTGKKGEMVNVSDGFANNFLIKRGLAMAANTQNMAEKKAKDEAEQHRLAEELTAAKKTAASINEKNIKIKAKAGENGKLFGAVTEKDVAEEIEKQLKVAVDKRKVSLDEDIKSFGTFTAEVKLYPNVSAKVFVIVGE